LIVARSLCRHRKETGKVGSEQRNRA